MADIAVGAKRYDGASGSAVFTGCIPLKPGQLFEADLNKVAIWDGQTEIGCTAGALWPLHADGSLKVVRIAATLDLASGVQKDLTLRVGALSTVQGPELPVINQAWLRAPRLIGCTSAAHMCESQLAPLPLCPIPNPNLPQRWNDALTVEWDTPDNQYPNWARYRNRVLTDDHSPSTQANPKPVGSANYNMLAPLFYKYMTSGQLDRLNDALHLSQYGSPYQGTVYTPSDGFPISFFSCSMGSKFSAAPYTNSGVLNSQIYNADGTLFDANPEGWPDRGPSVPGTGDGGPMNGNAEWYTGTDTDMYMAYVLGGWEQAKACLLHRALREVGTTASGAFQVEPGTIAMSNVLQGNAGSMIVKDNVFKGNYGGRSQWRNWRSADLYYFLLSPPAPLQFKYLYWNGKQLPSPRTNRADWVRWLQREHLDFYAAYSARYTPGHWLKDSWWHTPGWSPGTTTLPQGIPFFQLKLLLHNVLYYYQNVDTDARIPSFITASANRLRQSVSQALRPFPVASAGSGRTLVYSIFNSYTNNATDGPVPSTSNNDGFWGTTMLMMYFVLAHQLTGDPWYLDLADRHATNKGMSGLFGPAGFNTGKEFGEYYSDLFHAAAYRAGVPLGQMTLAGVTDVEPGPSTLPPPPPPPPPPTPIPTEGNLLAQYDGPVASAPAAVPVVGPLPQHLIKISVKGLDPAKTVQSWMARTNFAITGTSFAFAEFNTDPASPHADPLIYPGEAPVEHCIYMDWPFDPALVSSLSASFKVRVTYTDATFEEVDTAAFPALLTLEERVSLLEGETAALEAVDVVQNEQDIAFQTELQAQTAILSTQIGNIEAALNSLVASVVAIESGLGALTANVASLAVDIQVLAARQDADDVKLAAVKAAL